MERENRYIVFKIKDVEEFLSPTERLQLAKLATGLELDRANKCKRPLECVVVEDDWPEYEQVWDMIEKRVDGGELK